jgi:hypothetical protein
VSAARRYVPPVRPGNPCGLAKRSKTFVAAFLVAWLVLSSLVASSPLLHHAVHDDAGQSSHQCAFTLLEQQQVLSSDGQVVTIVLITPVTNPSFTFTPATIEVVDLLAGPPRAPPV